MRLAEAQTPAAEPYPLLIREGTLTTSEQVHSASDGINDIESWRKAHRGLYIDALGLYIDALGSYLNACMAHAERVSWSYLE